MSGLLLILLIIAMIAVVVVLFLGLFSMARGGEFNAKYGNRLMQLRVVFQGIAVVLFIAVVLVSQSG